MNKEGDIMKRTLRSPLEKKTPLMNLASVLMAVYSFITIYMLFFLFFNSFKTRSDLLQNTMSFPKQFVIDNYKHVIIEDGFLRFLFNSVILTVMACIAEIVISSMVAYGLARFKFKGKNLLSRYFMIGMMFPIQLGILPLFVMMRKLNLINTFHGMVLVYTAGMALPVFIFSTFFQTLPTALYEAAMIDGAGEYTIFFKIMMPVAKPIIITQALLTTINIWNNFFLPLVMLQRDQLMTATLGVYKYTVDLMRNWYLVFPASILTILPILIIFAFLSDKIIAGMTNGSVKG